MSDFRHSAFGNAAGPEHASGRNAHPGETRVQRILKLRRRRDQIFGPALFGEPAWDILLLVYDAQLHGRTESLAGLLAAIEVPVSTVHRWMNVLMDESWIERARPSCDQRQFSFSLTAKGLAAMEQIFSEPELRG